jgi:hypothetical protein
VEDSQESPTITPSDQRVQRPKEAKVAAISIAVLGVLGLFLTWLVLWLLDNDKSHGRSVAGGYFVFVYVQFALSGLQVVSGVLVWRGVGLGRILGIVLCVVNVLGAVGTLASGAVVQAIFAVVLNIVLIRMLADEEVGHWVG